jgi:isopentenyl diphosphate isomerase/L-lactate dehydrogenase-like FMN-dependent dehydrogenase
MLELMELEIRTAMGLMGVTSLSELSPSWVRPTTPATPAGTTTGYPWYEEQLARDK